MTGFDHSSSDGYNGGVVMNKDENVENALCSIGTGSHELP